MLHSDYSRLCPVSLPYKDRQRYMHGFDLAKPVMAEGFEDYLEPVTALIDAAGVRRGTAFMTVDEKIVDPGRSQRRPGPHVDGQFMPEKGIWGHVQTWNHYCNNVPIPRMPIIVAASVPGCRAWKGNFDAAPTESGDLSHISHILGEGEVLPANIGYLLTPDCVHESMIFDRAVERTFLRIALPVGSI